MGIETTTVNILLLLLLSAAPAFQQASAHRHRELPEEEYIEELILRPLPDRKVLAHFDFTNSLPPTNIYGRHHKIFPKAIYQLVQKFRIQEMELSFTQGRWNYERWGGYDSLSSSNAKPPGVELWAIFDVPLDQVDETWKKLTHALSGLFCASVNFLESSAAYASPEWTFRSDLINNTSEMQDVKHTTSSDSIKVSSSRLRYGALPREAVCTENLTPWLKLLPCRDKAGIAALFDRPSIYRGFYHSQRLRVLSGEFSSEKTSKHLEGTLLQQTLTLVLQPGNAHDVAYASGQLIQPSWSIRSLFGRELVGKCLIAKSSSVFLELERTLVQNLESSREDNGNPSLLSDTNYPSFNLNAVPDRVLKETAPLKSRSGIGASSIVFLFMVDKYNKSHPLNVGLIWKVPVNWSSLQAPFHASRFLMGSGNARGSIVISLKASESQQELWEGDDSSVSSSLHDCSRSLLVFQVVPWYVRLYFHTLQVFMDGQPKLVWDVVKKIHISPAEDRKSPGMMEIKLEIPCNTSSSVLIVNFDKGFLRIDEYPPDANQGFDLPSTHISFPDFQTNRWYSKEKASKSSSLLEFLYKSSVQLYTEVLLVPLATPDFSMPYNVITLTCTVLALYFGSLLNVLRRRIGEEERYQKEVAAKGGRLKQFLSKLSSRVVKEAIQGRVFKVAVEEGVVV
ncbi:hypothetical protein SUGI_1098370 [Cryptomeria japonica]|nr:hypothetical protein SUGI_1098370 [Cryptomeria japonica]